METLILVGLRLVIVAALIVFNFAALLMNLLVIRLWSSLCS